jgi:cytochrome c oxidase subunit 2
LYVRLHPGKAFAILLSAIALASVILFLSSAWWMPAAASQHALVLDRQFNWTLINAGVAFLLAQLILAGLVWTFRAGGDRASRAFPNGIHAAMIVSVIFIGIELVSAATVGRSAWASMYLRRESTDVVRVEATGQQFAFYFRYPGSDGKFGPVHVEKIDPSIGNYFGLDRARDPASKDDVTSATLALPVNHPVELLLEAHDVIHGFYVRELRIQQDMVPGMQIPVHFTPTRIGRYEIACTQLCGLGHYRMRAFLDVMSDADFQKWMQAHER